jgi:hypothetical protein
MATTPDWAAKHGNKNLYTKVQEALLTYSDIFGKTFVRLEFASTPILSKFSIAHHSAAGESLIKRSQLLSSLTRDEYAGLANAIALHLVNSQPIRDAVHRYWEIQVRLLTIQSEAVAAHIDGALNADQVYYMARVNELSEKMCDVTQSWEESDSELVRLMTMKEIEWDNNSESEDDSSSSKVGMSEEDSDSSDADVAVTTVAAVAARDASPVRK